MKIPKEEQPPTATGVTLSGTITFKINETQIYTFEQLRDCLDDEGLLDEVPIQLQRTEEAALDAFQRLAKHSKKSLIRYLLEADWIDVTWNNVVDHDITISLPTSK